MCKNWTWKENHQFGLGYAICLQKLIHRTSTWHDHMIGRSWKWLYQRILRVIVSPSENVALRFFLFYCSSFYSEKVNRLRADVLQEWNVRTGVWTYSNFGYSNYCCVWIWTIKYLNFIWLVVAISRRRPTCFGIMFNSAIVCTNNKKLFSNFCNVLALNYWTFIAIR